MQKYLNEYMGQIIGGLTMELAQFRAQCDQLQAENQRLKEQISELADQENSKEFPISGK